MIEFIQDMRHCIQKEMLLAGHLEKKLIFWIRVYLHSRYLKTRWVSVKLVEDWYIEEPQLLWWNTSRDVSAYIPSSCYWWTWTLDSNCIMDSKGHNAEYIYQLRFCSKIKAMKQVVTNESKTNWLNTELTFALVDQTLKIQSSSIGKEVIK